MLWIIFVFIAVLLVLAAFSIVIVEQYHGSIVKRFGKYKRVLPAGFHIIIPFIDTVIDVDLKKTPVSFVVDNIKTPDSSPMSFPVHLFCLTTDPIEEKLNTDPLKQIEEMFSQIISDFTKDEKNPPRNWDEALAFSKGDKYISRIVAVILGIVFPTYDRDGECADDPKHNHTDVEKEMIKKGAYKLQSCMTEDELSKKAAVKAIANDLIAGKALFKIPGTGKSLVQLTIESPVPTKELQESINKRNEITQQTKAAEERLALEEKERDYEIYDEVTQAIKVNIASGITGIDPDKILYRKLQKEGNISGNEYNINVTGFELIDKIFNLFKKGVVK